jgi:hypothetical protein
MQNSVQRWANFGKNCKNCEQFYKYSKFLTNDLLINISRKIQLQIN